MDKLFRSIWFIRAISLALAIMLYMVVTSEQGTGQQKDGQDLSRTSDANNISMELEAQYDEDKYIVSGLPETVRVYMEGSSNAIQNAKFISTKKAFVNLKNKGPGNYKVKVQTDGFPKSLDLSVDPSTVNVTIQKKKTEKFPVSIDLMNEGKIKGGYKVGDIKTDPETVEVTGSENAVKSVAYIKGVVNLSGADADVEKEVPLYAYDKDGNQLNVTLDPSTVDVTVPLNGPTVTVPVSFKLDGSLPDGYMVKSIEAEPDEVKIAGSQEVLASITKLADIPLDVSGLDGDNLEETVNVQVPVPEGAEKVEPETLKVDVTLGKKEQRVFQEMPIQITGKISDNEKITFIDPVSRSTEVTLVGTKTQLNQVSRQDIKLAIDVTDLSEGEHAVPLTVSGPDYVKTDPEQDTVKIKISKVKQ